jgi:hypothetical protein
MSINNLKPNRAPSALLDAQGREFGTMPYAAWQAIVACDDTLRAHGMRMKIYCEECVQAGHPQPFVMGDNERGGAVIELKCPHKRWRCLLT